MGQISDAWSPRVGTEARKALEIAFPMIVTNLVYFLIMVSSLMFVGQLGVLELSGAALGNSLGSVTGFTVMIGLASGLETLCGQAYGAKLYHMLGVYYQTSVLVLLACSVPLSILWWNIEPVLLLIGQEAEIAGETARYMRALIPALWAAAATQPTIKYLQTQSVVLPIMICSVTTFAVHIPLCYLMVYKVVGSVGGAWCISISYWLILLQLLAFVAYSSSKRPDSKKTWTGFVTPKLPMIWLYIRLAVASAFMIILNTAGVAFTLPFGLSAAASVQFWAFELLVLLSGLLPDPERQVSLLSICLNTAGVAFTLPFGLSAAASTRISNELGAGSANGARLAMKVVVGISMCQALVVASAMLLFRSHWGRLFSNEPVVVSDAAAIMPFLALGTFMDGIQGAIGGVLRGCGLQDPATIVSLFAFYAVGVPSALLFGFYFNWGAKGLYGGCICGSITQLFLVVVIVVLINWDKEVEKAESRVGEKKKVAAALPLEKGDRIDIYEPLLSA